MAIRIVTRPKAEDPGTMPKAGGPVTTSFVAQSTAATFLQQTCTIRPKTPYVFADPADPANPKVQEGPIEPVSIAQERFTLDLELEKEPGKDDVLQALMDLSIQEVTPTGRVRQVASSPVPPSNARIVVTIE